MLTRSLFLGVALTLSSASAFAQTTSPNAPWTVALTTTVNPVPIGGCGPVWLTLKDSTGKATPRDPQGKLITIADFDMTVTSADPNAVVGAYNGASAWSACACQAATIGDAATITATYPASMLASKARVPGVSFQSTATITIAAAKGSSNPAGCGTQKFTTASLARGPALGTATPGSPLPAARSSPALITAPLGNMAASPSDPPGIGGTDAIMTIDSGSFVMRHIAGGSAVSEISVSGGVISRTGKLHYEPIVVDVQPGGPMDAWIDAAWGGVTMPKTGSIERTVLTNRGLTSTGQLLFTNGLIASTTIPAIDASNKNNGYVRVTFTPSSTSEGAGTTPAVAARPNPNARWQRSDYRFTITNLDGSGVSRIESFVVAGASSTNAATGQVARANVAATVPSLLVTLSESSAAGWIAWYDDTVKGAGKPTEKTLVLELLASDRTTIATIKGSGVGIVSLRLFPGSNQGVPRVQAELYARKIELLP